MQAQRVTEGVHRLRTGTVNVYFVAASVKGASRPPAWVLIDTGLAGYRSTIEREARRLFNRPPLAIVLTHGHFDHVGNLKRLANDWGVPLYAHRLEMPYLTGQSPYPPPDPSVGGGSQSWLSPLYPRGPIDLGRLARMMRMLPEGGEVPALPEWRWLPTPGHSPGHVSFFRDFDRLLVAGDAVVTTKQESTMNVLLQRERVWRPPAYFTCDWNAARRSVERIAELEPEVLATGHGHVMQGPTMRERLRDLSNSFDRIMPATGRYVPYPAITDEQGIVHVPPQAGIAVTRTTIAVGAAAALGAAWFTMRRTAR